MGKMSDAIRKQRLAELLGIEAPKEPTYEERKQQEANSREAEAVLLYVEDPKRFREVKCKWCERIFAVNRTAIGYCSDACRQKALHEIGIEWDPNSANAEERWTVGRAGREPLVVPPQALELVKPPQAELTQTA